MQNEKKNRRNLSDFAFQENIEYEGVEIPGIENPSGISAITKSLLEKF